MDLSQYLPLLIYYLFGSIPTEKFYKKLPKKEINNLGPILSKSFFLSILDFLKGIVGGILFTIFYESFSNYLADYGIFLGILMSSIAKFLLVIPIVFKELRKNKTLFISYVFYMCDQYSGIITFIILSSNKLFKQKINIKENNEVNSFKKRTS